MNKRWYHIILFCLIMIRLGWAAENSKPVRLALRYISISNDNKAEMALWQLCENAMENLIEKNQHLSLVAADSLEFAMGELPSKDFYQVYEPISLARIRQTLGIDILLFCSLAEVNDAPFLKVGAREFPSGIPIDSLGTPVTVSGQNGADSVLASSEISAWLDSISVHWPEYGTPVSVPEQSLLVLTGSLEDTSYVNECAEVLSEFQFDESKLPFYTKVLSATMQVTEPCTYGRKLLYDTNINTGIYIPADLAKATPLIFFRPDSAVFTGTIDAALPICPDNEKLSCCSISANNGSYRVINDLVFGRSANDAPVYKEKEHLDLLKDCEPVFFDYCIHEHRRMGADVDADSLRYLEDVYVSLMRQFPGDDSRGWILLNLADFYLRTGDPGSALALFINADSAFKSYNNLLGMGISRMNRGKILSEQKRWPEARDAYSEAMKIARVMADTAISTKITYNMAMLFELEEDFDQAMRFYTETADLYNKTGQFYDAAQIYEHLGQVMREHGEMKKAVAYLDTFLLKARAMGSEPAMSRAHFQLGLTAYARKDFEKALEHFRNSADYMELLADSSGLARIDLNMGSIFHEMNNDDMARQRYHSALYIAEAIRDSSMIYLCQVNLAGLAADKSAWAEVHDRYDQALAIAERLNDTSEQAKIIYAKGLAHIKEGLLRTGYQEIVQAIELGGGTVSGDVQAEQEFLRKLRTLIGDIQNIHAKRQKP